MLDGSSHWEMFLRGAVAGLLLFHVIHLALPGARPATRAALAAFTLSVLAYVFCQQAEVLLGMPRLLAYPLLALCVSSTAWMWIAARALFNDDFVFSSPVLGAALALVALGLVAYVPYLAGAASARAAEFLVWTSRAHAAAMLVFAGATLWEIVHGWSHDLVEPRRAARRWVAMGIGTYAALALVVELALRGHDIGRLLPALHVLGIGGVTLALAVLVARHSIDRVLGIDAATAPGEAHAPDVADAPDPPVPQSAHTAEIATAATTVAVAATRPNPALARLTRAMTEERAYRHEGLTLAALATTLGMGEAALRGLINQQLGYRNFNDYLHHYRLQEAAARLVAEDRPILSIALECGYGSIGPFNRAFRLRMGMTPSEYRGASRLTGRTAKGAAADPAAGSTNDTAEGTATN